MDDFSCTGFGEIRKRSGLLSARRGGTVKRSMTWSWDWHLIDVVFEGWVDRLVVLWTWLNGETCMFIKMFALMEAEMLTVCDALR
jgi:hypothetical protein